MTHSLWNDRGKNRIREGAGKSGDKGANQIYLCRKLAWEGWYQEYLLCLIFRWERCEQVYGLEDTGEDGGLGDQIYSLKKLEPVVLFLKGQGGKAGT